MRRVGSTGGGLAALTGKNGPKTQPGQPTSMPPGIPDDVVPSTDLVTNPTTSLDQPQPKLSRRAKKQLNQELQNAQDKTMPKEIKETRADRQRAKRAALREVAPNAAPIPMADPEAPEGTDEAQLVAYEDVEATVMLLQRLQNGEDPLQVCKDCGVELTTVLRLLAALGLGNPEHFDDVDFDDGEDEDEVDLSYYMTLDFEAEEAADIMRLRQARQGSEYEYGDSDYEFDGPLVEMNFGLDTAGNVDDEEESDLGDEVEEHDSSEELTMYEAADAITSTVGFRTESSPAEKCSAME